MKNTIKKMLLDSLLQKGRILNGDEAADFYVENIMRNPNSCKLSPFGDWSDAIDKDTGKEITVFKEKRVEMSYGEIKNRAMLWYTTAIGSLVRSGDLGVIIRNQKGLRFTIG